MDIVKLSEICEIINGKDLHANIPLGKIISAERTKMPYVKTSCFSNGFQSEPTYYVKNEYIDDINVPKLIVNKDDLVISKACSVGEPNFIVLNNTSITRALTQLKPNEKFILKKYLYYYLIKNNNYFKSHSSGTTIKHFSLKILNDFPISLINLKSQQSIIDIIEPKEKLFLKFKNLVRIDNIENCKNDMKNLIDIIEPFEILVESVLKKIRINLKITELIINNFYSKNGLFKENEIEFFKGINFKKEMISENNSDILFINVSAINDKPNKFIKLEYINMVNVFEGDVILSLDGNTGLVNNCLKGINGYGYKIASDKIKNSQIYYSLLSKINQDIINQNSFGTTIQHASKSKDKIILLNFGENQKILDIFFDLEIIYKKKVKLLKKIISSLIEIYTR